MNKKGPSLKDFQSHFATEDDCLDHLFQVRYGTDFTCPKCERPAKYSRVKGRRAYQCQWCANQVYPTAGTPFDRTRTSLRDWFTVMFLFCTTRNGVAAKEVQRLIGVTYKTAWRMCHEIRKYMAEVDGNAPVGGSGTVVEADETIIGGKISGQKRGRHLENKTIVMGMVERGGNVVTEIVPNVKRSTLTPVLVESVKVGSEVHTDYLQSYRGLALRGYIHCSVNHNAGEYVRGSVHTQTIEGFWSQVKRGISGTHIHVSRKHLPKYLGEFEYRWNNRHQPQKMLERLMMAFWR